MTYLAHRDPENGREQSVLTHLQGTARLAADFAGAFGSAEEGRRCGMLHDIGKYSDAFQRRAGGGGSLHGRRPGGKPGCGSLYEKRESAPRGFSLEMSLEI